VILTKGDMWSAYDKADWFCITTNATINAKGELVMGRGIALEAKKKYPDLPGAFAKELLRRGAVLRPYGLLVLTYGKIIAFQVKYGWWEKANLDLIRFSTEKLNQYALEHREKSFHLNFPGIGNGQLAREDVLPIIQQLPDNVTVWEY
jgi:hypothetical protein